MPENSENVRVGTLIALLVEEGDDWKNVEIPEVTVESTPAPVQSKSEKPSAKPILLTSSSTLIPKDAKGERLLGPAVRNYLAKYGLEAGQIPGQGPHGSVLKSDVIKYALANKVRTVPVGATSSPSGSAVADQISKRIPRSSKKAGPATFKEVEITNMRKVIAKRLLQSKVFRLSYSKHFIHYQFCYFFTIMYNLANLLTLYLLTVNCAPRLWNCGL